MFQEKPPPSTERPADAFAGIDSHIGQVAASIGRTNVLPFRKPDPSEHEPELTSQELRALRRLLALGPDRIEAAVRGVEVVRTACPTFRRELSGE